MAKSKMPKIKVKPGPIRLCLYTRVSTDRQAEEGYSLAIQEEKLRAFAATMDGTVEVELLRDDGYSGGSLDRPGIQTLIREVEAGAVTHVAVMKLDRLSRSLKDTMYLIEDVFLKNNVSFISLYESFDTGTPFGRAMVGILSVFAQFERENIYERTRGGMLKRVEAGLWPGGGGIPFGYDYDREKGILVPNEDAEKVKHLYERYLSGESLQSIADKLGLKYERVAYNILTRKSNAGYIIYNGEEYKGKHEAIISEEVYHQAMAAMRERAGRRVGGKSTHLLTGLVRCGQCGARMRYAKWGKAGYKLVCYSRQTSKQYLVHDPDCTQEAVWADEVERGVLEALFAAAEDQKLRESQKTIEGENVSGILERKIEREETKLRRLYHLYGESEDQTLMETIESIRSGLDKLRKELEDEEKRASRLAEIRGICSRLEKVSDLWPVMPIQEQKMVLATVFENIIVDGDSVKIIFRDDNRSLDIGTSCR